MGHKNGNKRRLVRLWLEDCHCHWCKRPTVLYVSPPLEKHPLTSIHRLPHFEQRASLDHINSKLTKERRNNPTGKINTVLACYECNQRRNNEETKSIPIEELWKRSGKYPKNHLLYIDKPFTTVL